MQNEQNNLIAEFMGYKIDRNNEWIDNLGLYIQDGREDLRFQSSWDRLMPVVDKIEAMLHDDIVITITYKTCLIPVVA